MKPKKQLSHWLKIAVIGIALGFALQFVRAWTEPAAAPPGGNVGAPINTGAIEQTKTGDICTTAPNGTGDKKCLSTAGGNLECAEFGYDPGHGGGYIACSYFSTVYTKAVSGGYQSACGENVDLNRPWDVGWYVWEGESASCSTGFHTYLFIRCCK